MVKIVDFPSFGATAGASFEGGFKRGIDQLLDIKATEMVDRNRARLAEEKIQESIPLYENYLTSIGVPQNQVAQMAQMAARDKNVLQDILKFQQNVRSIDKLKEIVSGDGDVNLPGGIELSKDRKDILKLVAGQGDLKAFNTTLKNLYQEQLQEDKKAADERKKFYVPLKAMVKSVKYMRKPGLATTLGFNKDPDSEEAVQYEANARILEKLKGWTTGTFPKWTAGPEAIGNFVRSHFSEMADQLDFPGSQQDQQQQALEQPGLQPPPGAITEQGGLIPPSRITPQQPGIGGGAQPAQIPMQQQLQQAGVPTQNLVLPTQQQPQGAPPGTQTVNLAALREGQPSTTPVGGGEPALQRDVDFTDEASQSATSDLEPRSENETFSQSPPFKPASDQKLEQEATSAKTPAQTLTTLSNIDSKIIKGSNPLTEESRGEREKLLDELYKSSDAFKEDIEEIHTMAQRLTAKGVARAGTLPFDAIQFLVDVANGLQSIVTGERLEALENLDIPTSARATPNFLKDAEKFFGKSFETNEDVNDLDNIMLDFGSLLMFGGKDLFKSGVEKATRNMSGGKVFSTTKGAKKAANFIRDISNRLTGAEKIVGVGLAARGAAKGVGLSTEAQRASYGIGMLGATIYGAGRTMKAGLEMRGKARRLARNKLIEPDANTTEIIDTYLEMRQAGDAPKSFVKKVVSIDTPRGLNLEGLIDLYTDSNKQYFSEGVKTGFKNGFDRLKPIFKEHVFGTLGDKVAPGFGQIMNNSTDLMHAAFRGEELAFGLGKFVDRKIGYAVPSAVAGVFFGPNFGLKVGAAAVTLKGIIGSARFARIVLTNQTAWNHWKNIIGSGIWTTIPQALTSAKSLEKMMVKEKIYPRS